MIYLDATIFGSALEEQRFCEEGGLQKLGVGPAVLSVQLNLKIVVGMMTGWGCSGWGLLPTPILET